jgi:hypothetical protein
MEHSLHHLTLTCHRENDLLKKQLTALGYEVPRTEWSMKPQDENEGHNEPPQNTNGGERSPPSRPSGGTHHRCTSSRTLIDSVNPGCANAGHRSSSSSRKRRHSEYVEDDSDILPDPPAAYQRESGDSMRPPQLLPLLYRDESGRPSHVSQTPSRRHRHSHRSEELFAGKPGSRIRQHGDSGRAQTYLLRHEQQQQDRVLSRDGSQYRMSGALPPIDVRGGQQQDKSNRNDLQGSRSRFSQPQRPQSGNVPFNQPIQRSDEVQQQQIPGGSRYVEQEYVLAPLHGRYAAQRTTNNRGPVRTFSQAVPMRQPLMVPPSSRAGKYPTNSGYTSNVNLHTQRAIGDDKYFINDTKPAPRHRAFESVPITPIQRHSPFFKRVPEFHVHRSPMLRNSLQQQPQRFGSDTRHLAMQPPSPIGEMGRSLNALSFINSPLTRTNRPIFEHGIRPYSSINHHNEPLYFTQTERSHSQRQPQSHVHQFRQSSDALSQRTFNRDDDMKLLGAIRGAKSGNSKFVPSAVPYSRVRGVFSSAGVGRRARY